MKKIIFIFYFMFSLSVNAQSFNEEKTSAINYIKRMFNTSSFEGAKVIEGEEAKYFAVAITLNNDPSESISQNNQIALTKAQVAAQVTFSEPCVKFEMVSLILNENFHKTTYLFICEVLSEFIKAAYKKKPFEGTKIVSAPNNKFITTVITLDNVKYNSMSNRDKVAQMKAKQQINILINGSTISSDMIIRTDENDQSTKVNSAEIIREHSMGFLDGIELLSSYESVVGKTTYIYYKTLNL